MLLIGADRLAKQCSNYNLISRQQAESSIPFNINNLTLYKNPLRIDFKASNKCFGGGDSCAPLLSSVGGHSMSIEERAENDEEGLSGR